MSDSKFMQGRIAERIDISDELAIFRVEPEAEFTFIPGQYATLGLECDGKLVERAYSIASSPYEPLLEFFIERVPDGCLTPSLFNLSTGGFVSIRRRFVGRFVLDTSARTHHLMVATVTGVAPFVSVLRTHVADIRGGRAAAGSLRFVVLHGASRSQEFGAYRPELEQLSKEMDSVTYVPTVSRWHEDLEWEGELGRVEDVLRKYCDTLPLGEPGLAAYLCGHPQMITNARGILQRSRVAPERIHEEKYFTIKS